MEATLKRSKEGDQPCRAPSTFTVSCCATPERVYRAFLDPDVMVKWLPPNGFTGKVHQLDVRIGGSYKMSFTNFTTTKSHSFSGEYLELIPHQRIR